MSGICGVCQPGRPFNQMEIREMQAGLTVDNREIRDSFCGDAIALSCSRRFEGQDLASVDGVRVVADCDLLNLEALRSSIQSAGKPAPAGTAGVLAALYSLRGPDFVHELDGAFAFALWDENKQRLVLAIDRLGIKNLYWRFARGALSFATRLSALRSFDSSLSISDSALAQFLVFSMVPAPLSIYSGVEKMRPGWLLTFEGGRVGQRQYWEMRFQEEERPVAEWARTVREELRNSVHRHLAGTDAAATGAFLSGGTDSSTVVAFMSERQSPVRTFSIVFNETPYSEAGFVKTTVEHFKAEAHECCLSPNDALDAIPLIAGYYDEPLANSSAIAAYFCGVMARERGVQVLLGGDGGDELFAGNQRYETDKYFALYHRLPGFLRKSVIEPLAGLLPRESHWLGLPQRYIQRALIPNPKRFFSYNFFLTLPAEEVFADDMIAHARQSEWLRIPEQHFAAAPDASELNRLLLLDIRMALADNDLKKVGGMAELAGIRVRYPFLDHRLAQLSGRVPTNLKLRGFEKRFIFKKAMENLLPHKVLYKKKHGMGVPISSWLLKDPKLASFANDVLHDSRTRARGYFRPGFVERLLELQRHEHVAYYGEIVWYLLVLELWHRQHVDGYVRAVCAD